MKLHDLIPEAAGYGILVYSHPSGGAILCDSEDDSGCKVFMPAGAESMTFLDLVVCVLKRFHMEDSYFVAVDNAAAAVQELAARLKFLA